MKLFLLLGIGSTFGQNNLATKIAKAEEKCGVFLEKALVCVPPEEKVSKYSHRLSKVLNDAKWHEVTFITLISSLNICLVYRKMYSKGNGSRWWWC